MTNKMELDDGVNGFRLSCTPFMLIATMDASLQAIFFYLYNIFFTKI